MRHVIDWLWLMRISVIGNVWLAFLTSMHILGLNIYQIEVFFGFISVTFLVAAGFVLNDINDIEKDRISHPKRPLPSGRISVRIALGVCISLLSLSFMFALMSGRIPILFEISLATLLIIFYTKITHRSGFLANIVTALLSTLPWIMTATIAMEGDQIILPTLITFLLVLTREVILDIHDVVGDRVAGIKTLPVIYGVNTISRYAIYMLWGITLTLIIIGVFNSYTIIFFLFTIIGFLLPTLLISFYLINYSHNPKRLLTAGHIGKVQFVCGLLAWLSVV